jgi:hypothetical protein
VQILHDIFPAFLSVSPKGKYEDVHEVRSHPPMNDVYHLTKTRIVVTDTNIIVAHDGPQGPVILFNEQYETFDKSNIKTEDSYVVTRSGKMLVYAKDENCGCGSRLRSWNPYKHLYSTKDPKGPS